MIVVKIYAILFIAAVVVEVCGAIALAGLRRLARAVAEANSTPRNRVFLMEQRGTR